MITQNVARPSTIPGKLDALVEFCFDSRYDAVHAPVRQLLLDKCFDRQEGLTSNENGHLAYERARFVGRNSLKPSEAASRIYDLCALAEWPGLCDVSVFSILMVHYNLTVGTVVDRMRESPYITQALEALDRFEAFGPYLATELGYGNNVAGLKTVATYDATSDSFTLNTPEPLAVKYMSYSGFTDIDKIAVVLARTVVNGKDVGVFPFLTPLTSDGASVVGVGRRACPEKPVQGLDNGLTWFSGCTVPREGWLSRGLGRLSESGEFVAELTNPRRRFLGAMSRIIPGRLCVCSSALGAGKAALYLALTFSGNRLTSAPGSGQRPIRDFLQYKLQVYPALACAYALTAQVNGLKRRFDVDPHDTATQIEISATKAVTTLAIQDVVAVCRERTGAQGMFSINRIADYVSLLQGLVTAEGDSQVLLATTAIQYLHADPVPPRQSPPDGAGLSGAGLSGTVGDLARRTDLIAQRYHDLRARTEDELPVFDRMNQSLPVALEFGAAWIARCATEAMLAQAAASRDVDAARALTRLTELYALTDLLRDPVDLLAAGAAVPEHLSTWRERVVELCRELDEDVDELVAAFRLTPDLLRAPIAVPAYGDAFLGAVGASPVEED